ncbi:shikimate dehydrogenase [Methanococcus voltae]|uniref:Shikimate dehydrogenase (NADP(+)) n=2 Tax=Methanococcus voltae TaxID=2188 RepID=A0A8J7UT27_METVO|nr:shikimate dehydrogenase [Methanococcus voltae]MBP2171842.1 shikimate dehydrogenase [Methanococcus voltae]MBP2201203.1 shikimate dehydrogenase [Methanococcus voltae]MCS3921926.1 shikimate dehydrogenase [Methanococcus voltae PS]
MLNSNLCNLLNSKTRILGVIGHPIAHSLSPIMHNSIIFKNKVNKLNSDAISKNIDTIEKLKEFKYLKSNLIDNLNYVYLAFDILPENLENMVYSAKILNIRGLNVTVPHKIDIMQYLDEIDEDAKKIGAVNTISFENGTSKGYNTDGLGFRKAIEELIETNNLNNSNEVKNKKILVLGAGGASRSICYEMSKDNFVTITNRTLEKAIALEKYLKSIGHKNVNSVKLDEFNDITNLLDYDIIVNTTSLGMHPNIDETVLNLSNLPENSLVGKFVVDIIYNPFETKFLKQASEKGAIIQNGLSMLVHQGAISFEIWTGIKPDVEIMKSSLLTKLNDKE